MASRMERYTNNRENRPTSRIEKNKKFYEDLYTNVGYTQFTNLDSNVVDLTLSSSLQQGNSRREQYQRAKEISPFFSSNEPTTRNYPDYMESFSSDDKEKVYDINQILEEARKNREHPDELEKRRKLRTTEYNILAELNSEKIKEYKEKKREVLTEEEEENLEELINTITSNTMHRDIEQQLLNDLMPTNLDETVIDENLGTELENKIKQDIHSEKEDSASSHEDDQQTEALAIDQSFYTKSMDLSKEDFVDTDSEEDETFLDVLPKRSKVVRLFIILAMLIILAVIVLIVYQYV